SASLYAEDGEPERLSVARGGLLEEAAGERQPLEIARLRPQISQHGKCMTPIRENGAAQRSSAGRGARVQLLPALRLRKTREDLGPGGRRCEYEQRVERIRTVTAGAANLRGLCSR